MLWIVKSFLYGILFRDHQFIHQMSKVMMDIQHPAQILGRTHEVPLKARGSLKVNSSYGILPVWLYWQFHTDAVERF
jgi:hypothetical protein